MTYRKEISTGLITLVVAALIGFAPLYSQVEANSGHREDSKIILMRLEAKLDQFSKQTNATLAELKTNQAELKTNQKFLLKEYHNKK